MSNPDFIVDAQEDVWVRNPISDDLYSGPGAAGRSLQDLNKEFGPLYVLNRGERLNVRLPLGTPVKVNVEDFKVLSGTVVDNKTEFLTSNTYVVRIDMVVDPERVTQV